MSRTNLIGRKMYSFNVGWSSVCKHELKTFNAFIAVVKSKGMRVMGKWDLSCTMMLLSSCNTVGKRLRAREGTMQPLESPKRKM